MIRLARYMRPYLWPTFFSVLFVFLQSLANLYLPTLMADIVDTGIVKGDLPYIYKMGTYMLFVTLAAGVLTVLANYLASKVAAGFGRDVRNKMFAHVETFSLNEFDQVGTSSLITRTTNDITQIEQVYMMILKMMTMAPLMCVGGIIMAVYQDAKLSLVLVVALPLLIVSILVLAQKGLPYFKKIQKKMDRLNLILREELTGIRVIRSFNREKHEIDRFDDANKDITHTSIRINQIMAAAMPLMMLIMNLSMVAIVWFGGLRINSGSMQVGDLMAFIQYAMQIMFSVLMGAMMFIMIPRAQISATRVNEVLDIQPDIQDTKSVGSSVNAESGLGVAFKSVTFSYPGAEKPALNDISFTARSGETTAIIGGTGAGKSTLLNLIPRYFDALSGSVQVNGVDVKAISVDKLRRMIGYVPQKSVLFTGTVAENIRYGNERATDEEIKEAARIAQANEFIQEMSEGYDSIIAQGGKNVSGGQKQRLAIARALARQADIYLLDDSFSALDYRTDARLRAELGRITQTAALIIVAQRVSTVFHADKIIVLDDGKIVGQGTHAELMETCTVYREIVASQLEKEELA
ncbi:ABC transporter ATP-binding protein/permease [Sporolactobacillus shoreicorticis]|uniref:ABC transporter ATP-binding protein n=1 Tax=Sporolactobacillus shoreicorticis TaxID=1923877 RepID=A0ABW5SBE3_9BACL|nr:ABC transporter ATP-binding protein [Sporolactobacillus shoreicorticis]MCO7127697.1 ABC transporter ATP-binding protein/permease [Sporolactobacillus shoreicorticis]